MEGGSNNSNNNQFWQFSDNLRLQTNSLANLSLNDSIWSTNYKRHAEERRNFDFRLNDHLKPAADYNTTTNNNNSISSVIGFRSDNDVWKAAPNNNNNINSDNMDIYSGFGSSGLNGVFNKGIYSNSNISSPALGFNSYSKGKGFANSIVVNGKVNKGGGKNEDVQHLHVGLGGNINNSNTKAGKKNGNNKGNKEGNKEGNGDSKSAADKRFKTLPPAEALPRNETIGGYIFVCNNDTMAENLKRQLFGLPPRYRDSVRAITPGLPLFLYNYSTHQLHGVFEAASFGGTNIDPTAWEDKKNPGESRFPAQVRVVTRKICEPLEEDSFRPILHHYDGPKFRLELNIPEALSLLDIFEENNSWASGASLNE